MQHRIYEYNLETGAIDVSDTGANPIDNQCYKYFTDILALGLSATGWEVDSDGKRLGLFLHEPESIAKMIEHLKIEVENVHILGVFFNSSGDKTIRIIKKLTDSERFDSCGINWYSYNYDTPDQISYELRATLDVNSFIGNDEIEKIKEKIPAAQSISHIKVKDGELLKIYFIEYYRDTQ